MPYPTQILYNGTDPFFPQPTPLVGIDYNNIYYTELWAKEEIFTLQGQLTGCNYSDITSAQKTILQNFAQSFQTLVVQETDNSILNVIYQKPFVEVQSINFAQSLWRGILPYTVTLKSYPSGFFSGAYGILNPIDKWDYNEQNNLSLEAIHTISCQGINVSSSNSNALDNAKNWAYGRTGLSNSINPLFINNANTGGFVQTILEEKIDRINGRYSITERYINDLTRPGYGVLRYTTNITSGHNLITVDLNGTVQGGNRDITDLRAAFSAFSPFGAASNAYSTTIFNNYAVAPDLNPYPLIQKISEDTYNAVISFNYVYDNDPSPQEVFDYDVTLNSGNLITASIEGVVKVRGGDIVQKYTNAIDFAGTLNLYDLTVLYYNQFYPYSTVGVGVPAFSLNPIPISSGMKVSLTDGTISLFATFDNKVKLSNILDRFDYEITVKNPIFKLDYKPIVGVLVEATNAYSVVDLKCLTRASFNIRGQALSIEYTQQNATNEIINVCTRIFAKYNNGVSNITLDEQSINYDRYDKKLINFSFTWSYNAVGFGANEGLTQVKRLATNTAMNDATIF